jgi:hypothetical protein
MANNSYLENTTQKYSTELSIEVAELQQAITLPTITTETINKSFFDNGGVLKTPDTEYDDMIGNFYIPILFPLVENGESTELEYKAPSTKNVVNKSIASSGYVERNFISLMIPKYIVMNFTGTIPKGTKFLVAFIGGSSSVDNMSIVGLYGHDL